MLSPWVIILSENESLKSLLKVAACSLVRCRPTVDLCWHDWNNLESNSQPKINHTHTKKKKKKEGYLHPNNAL
jgi:hypothetical protein